MSAAFLSAARDIVGTGHVLTEDLAAYTVDWRRKFSGEAVAVLRPGSTAEVQALVRLCGEHEVAIVPQGGNTSVCGASVPNGIGPQVIVSLSRMNRVRELDAGNSTITVEAGCVLQVVQDHAAAQGLLFPLSLGAEGSCQIGGNISTNAGGVQVLRYGNTRELVLGLEVVLPDGRVLDLLRGLRKDNTGYDLKQLFIGAEGTLGLITAATLKLFPAPSATVVAFAGLSSLAQAVSLLRGLRRRMGERFTAFEAISSSIYELTLHHFPDSPKPLARKWPWYVLMEAADGGTHEALADALQQALAEALEAGEAEDVAICSTLAQGEALWTLRENLTHSQERDGSNIKHDISVPVSAIPAFVDETLPMLAAGWPGSRSFVFGHLGDGNLHFNLSAPVGVGVKAWTLQTKAVNALVHAEVARRRGSISAEHGIGQLKKHELAALKTATELDVMRAVKQALDPRGLMNPGKVLG